MDNAFIINVFVTITYFLPGFIAKWTSAFLNDDSESGSDLEKTIVALSWNVPPLFIAWILLSLKDNQWLTPAQLTTHVQQMPCMLIYFVFSLISGFWIGRFIERLGRNILTRMVAKNREESKLPKLEDGLSWEKFLGSEENVVLKVSPISDPSRVVAGALQSAYRPGDIHKGVTLEFTDYVKLVAPYLTNPIRTFVDFESQLLFELYTKEQLIEAIEIYESV